VFFFFNFSVSQQHDKEMAYQVSVFCSGDNNL